MAGFDGLPVAIFESRRAAEMASLVTRSGGVVVPAPTIREEPVGDASQARAFADDLANRRVDAVVFMTGVGTRALVADVAEVLPKEAFVTALRHVKVVARGPKPSQALRDLGVAGFATVPSPATHVEAAAAVAGLGLAPGARVAVVEHGGPSPELMTAIEAGGWRATSVPVYRWSLVEDTGPLISALRRIASGEVRAVMFTSASQIDLALGVAATEGIDDAVRAALRAGFIASIGPVCSARLRAEGLEPDAEPELGRMGHLVKVAAERARAVLHEKGRR